MSIAFASNGFDLSSLGFDSHFEREFQAFQGDLLPARVAVAHRGRYLLFAARGEIEAELAGRLQHEAHAAIDLPTVGDWVAFRANDERGGVARIEACLPRRTAFVRGASGRATEAQVVAANVDVAWIVTSLDRDFRARRLERYLTVARAAGARPVIVLTKIDACDSVGSFVDEASSVAGDAGIHAVSAISGEGMDALIADVGAHAPTLVLIGSSGTGKSTLVNRLTGAAHDTLPLGSGARGRHTTTRRMLVPLPNGGVIIDTPGMRELRLWDDDDAALDSTFAEIAALATECRFRDCAHEGEPGCAVAGALEDGTLEPSRWKSFEKLRRETAALAARKDLHVALEVKRRIKRMSRAARVRDKER